MLNEEVFRRRKAESEVRQVNVDLERMVKERTSELEAVNTELDAFAAAVSHDLRAPLRGIIGAAKMLSQNAADRLIAEDFALLDQQNKAAIRMSRLIDSLLQMARFSRAEVRKKELDLSRVAEEAIETVAADFREAGTTFKVEAGMRAYADPDLIRFVFENLIGNACKFSTPVERPTVEVGRIAIGGSAANAETQYFVRDNGVGFDAAHAHLLFVPFERLHHERDFAGSGVGLANVSRIVRRHGGRVWAEGAVGQGATFYFTLG
jgi:light-regulated signal transduction histidine kinase (bacteriophytochrome)